MILVTGANGNLGSQTIDFLLETESAFDIAGLVRSEEKGAELAEKGVELRIGDYADYTSMERAVEGIDVVLLISSSTFPDRPGQHKNVIDAAKEADVGHIFYTSMVEAGRELSPMATDHSKTERLIKNSGLPYTIHRHTFYTEFLPLFLGDALETGEWHFPSDGEQINLAYRSEMAEALANALKEADSHKNRIYEITSGNAYTLNEIARMLSEASGKQISYHDVPVSQFKKTLEEIGLPEDQVSMSVMTARTFVNGALHHTYDHLEQLLGRKPKDTSEFIQDFAGS